MEFTETNMFMYKCQDSNYTILETIMHIESFPITFPGSKYFGNHSFLVSVQAKPGIIMFT